ncbi:uncharacterized protein YegL [Catenulispora sp. EB89]|uniref:vWA domain-containing protein n=1 Tax=Catenulispora sp. EB89 TaxID=3156257 RepID=UPI003517246D
MTADPSTFARHGYHERIPLVLVLDTSASMGRPADAPRIVQLKDALSRLLAGLRADPAHSARVDVAFILFASSIQEPGGGFRPVADVVVPPLTAGGHSVMLPAIWRALRLGEDHRSALVSANVLCRHPVVCLITDGAPTDGNGELQTERDCALVAKELRVAEANGSRFVAVGVGGADLDLLATLAPKSHFAVGDFDIGRVVDIITASVEMRATGGNPDADYGLLEKLKKIQDLENGM